MAQWKRILSMIFAVALTVQMLPSAAFAEQEEAEPTAEQAIEVMEESAEETDAAEEPEVPEEKTEPEKTEEPEETEEEILPVPEEESAGEESAEEPEEEPELVVLTAASEAMEYAVEGYSPDELLDGYLYQAFGGMDRPAAFSVDRMEDLFDGINLQLYRAAKEMAENVAAGRQSETYVTLSLEDVGYANMSWSAEDLGVASIVENGAISNTAVSALKARLNLDGELVTDAVLADCPYEMYWCGLRFTITSFSYRASWDGKEYRLAFDDSKDRIGLYFTVVDSYAGSGTYMADTAKTSAVSGAIDNARNIVARYAGSSDMEKLIGYTEELCRLNTYNTAAAGSGGYGDPWQIIYMFDGDAATNVVCEGYAKSFQYLCDNTAFDGDIYTYRVTGDMGRPGNTGPHMWNMLHMDDGRNYLVDVTNCDQRYGVEMDFFMAIPDSGTTSHYVVRGLDYIYNDTARGLYSVEELTLSDTPYTGGSAPESGNTGACGANGDNLTWTLDSDGTLTVSGTGAMADWDADSLLLAPGGAGRENIIKVEILPGVTSVGSYAFSGCSNLTEVVLPDSLAAIGDHAFDGCGSLAVVFFAGDKPVIGDSAFTAAGTKAYYPCGNSTYADVSSDAALTWVREHTVVTVPAVPATCTESGWTEGKSCSVCGEALAGKSVIPAKGHSVVEDPAVRPTCTTSGLTEGAHCPDCGYVIVAQQVSPPSHTPVADPEVTRTCTVDGRSEGSHCSVCGTVLVPQNIFPAPGHTVVTEEGVPATCTSTGLSGSSYCSVCGEILQAQQTIAAKGHTEVTDAAVAATCTAAGKTEGKHCSVCNEILVAQQPVAAKGHTEVTDAAVAATCTTAGKTEGKHCSVCKVVLVAQQPVAAKGHTPVADPEVTRTCTVDGRSEGSHCSVCGTVLVPQNIFPAPGHAVVTEEGVPATCTSTGLTESSHCSVCGEVLAVQQVIPKLTHSSAALAKPVIASVSAAANGVTVKWNAVAGAEKYRVFYKTGTGSWTKAADTAGTSYTVTGLTGGMNYTFTVRCICPDCSAYVSSFDAVGKSVTYIAQPVLSSVTNASNGVTVKWNAVTGAEKYRVFYKTAGGAWTKATDTTGTSYTVTGLTSGTTYYFTVRCMNAAGTAYTSSFDAVGKSITYKPVSTTLATPVLSSVANVANGVTVKWNAVTGAEKYRVFYKTAGGSWTKAADTTGTSYTVTGLTSGTAYTFTVRCLSADSKSYTSSFDTVGKSITYQPTLAAPVLTSVANASNGVTVKWNAVTGAAKYRVFYRVSGGPWTKAVDTTSTSCTVTGLTSGTVYAFTVRCINAAGTAYTSSFDTVGKGIVYRPVTAMAPAPKLSVTSQKNERGETVYDITWTEVPGATRYRVYSKNEGSSSWTAFTEQETNHLFYLSNNPNAADAAGPMKKTFTVRAISADGKSYLSAYDTTGLTLSIYGYTGPRAD